MLKKNVTGYHKSGVGCDERGGDEEWDADDNDGAEEEGEVGGVDEGERDKQIFSLTVLPMCYGYGWVQGLMGRSSS